MVINSCHRFFSFQKINLFPINIIQNYSSHAELTSCCMTYSRMTTWHSLNPIKSSFLLHFDNITKSILLRRVWSSFIMQTSTSVRLPVIFDTSLTISISIYKDKFLVTTPKQINRSSLHFRSKVQRGSLHFTSKSWMLHLCESCLTTFKKIPSAYLSVSVCLLLWIEITY